MCVSVMGTHVKNMCICVSEREREEREREGGGGGVSAVPACEKFDKHVYLCI